jgi:hypothetical protein
MDANMLFARFLVITIQLGLMEGIKNQPAGKNRSLWDWKNGWYDTKPALPLHAKMQELYPCAALVFRAGLGE